MEEEQNETVEETEAVTETPVAEEKPKRRRFGSKRKVEASGYVVAEGKSLCCQSPHGIKKAGEAITPDMVGGDVNLHELVEKGYIASA